MGGDGCNDDVVRGISSQYFYTYYGDDSKEGRRRGMLVGLGECGIGDHMYLDNKGIHKEEACNNGVICSRYTNIRTLYRRRAYGGFQ